MKIDHWCVVSRSFPSFEAPEQDRTCLHGVVCGHPRCADGKEVTTSLIVSRDGGKVVTKSGSQYELGEVDEMYEAVYPEARQRLLNRLARSGAVLAPVPIFEI